MRNFQDAFETRKQSFIRAFLICMTVPLIIPLIMPLISKYSQNFSKKQLCLRLNTNKY